MTLLLLTPTFILISALYGMVTIRSTIFLLNRPNIAKPFELIKQLKKKSWLSFQLMIFGLKNRSYIYLFLKIYKLNIFLSFFHLLILNTKNLINKCCRLVFDHNYLDHTVSAVRSPRGLFFQ